HIPAEGKLVGTIETVGSEIVLWRGIVLREVNEVAVSRAGNIAREGVGDLHVQVADARQGIVQILLERSLQAVVDLAPNWEQDLVGTQIGVDSGKCSSRAGSWARESAAQRIAGIEAIGREVCNVGSVYGWIECRRRAGSGTNRQIDGGLTAGSQCRRDRSL